MGAAVGVISSSSEELDQSEQELILSNENKRRFSLSKPINTFQEMLQLLEAGNGKANENGKFIDQEFLASEQSSLFYKEDEDVNNWPDIVMKSMTSTADNDNSMVIYDNISPNDIQQGALGDCYLLSCLSVLAERPDRIKKMFSNFNSDSQAEINSYGLFGVILFKNGIKQEIILDDIFPCIANNNNNNNEHDSTEFVFSKSSKSNELWVPLIEKAYAKIHGSYQRIISGSAEEALVDLTGAPTRYFHHDDTDDKYDKLWKMLQYAEEMDFVMAGNISGDREVESELGLIAGHLYGVLAVRLLDDENDESNKIKLVHVRNPWGNTEWKGDWSDQSDLWTENAKEICQWKDEDDGSFWMSYHDYFHYFDGSTILYYYDHYEYCYHVVTPDVEIIEFTIDNDNNENSENEEIPFWCSARQRDKRCLDIDDDTEYMMIRYQIIEISGDDDDDNNNVVCFSQTGFRSRRDLPTETVLKKGCRYQVIIERSSLCGVREVVFCTYSPMKVTWTTNQDDVKPMMMTMNGLEKIYQNRTMSSSDLEILPIGEEGNGVTLCKSVIPWGIIHYYKNESDNVKVMETMDVNGRNLQIICSSNVINTTKKELTEAEEEDGKGDTGNIVTENTLEITLMPQEKATVVILSKCGSNNYSYSTTRSFMTLPIVPTSQKHFISRLKETKTADKFELINDEEKLKRAVMETEFGMVIIIENISDHLELIESVEFEFTEGTMEIYTMNGSINIDDGEYVEYSEPCLCDSQKVEAILPPQTWKFINIRATEKGLQDGYGYGWSAGSSYKEI